MIKLLYLLAFVYLSTTCVLQFQAHAAPAGPLIKHLSSLLKWTGSASKTPHSDGNFLQFEKGHLVETVVEGNELGVVPYRIRVSDDGELFAVDEVNSNIVKITPPLSQYSRARLVAGSFEGYTGHVDGKPTDARFNHPKGVTMDDKGNIYVADTSNLAIRKIGEGGVTTIAGGKTNVAGYRDGPSEGAMFSTDFDVIYVPLTCSLLVVDRGNAALRQISLNQDCHRHYLSISATDIYMVIGAIFMGYLTCMLQQGFGPSFFLREVQKPKLEAEYLEQLSEEKPTPTYEPFKEEQEAGWSSLRRLIIDLTKLTVEALASVFLYFIPFLFNHRTSHGSLTPLQESLVMPEDESEPPVLQKQRTPTPPSGHKMRSRSLRDPSLLSKYQASKHNEFPEFYRLPEEVPSGRYRSKSNKERTRHRQWEKSREEVNGTVGEEEKPAYEDKKFEYYNTRTTKYGGLFRFDQNSAFL
ncbi:hypothetical protein NMG60_11003332 [Bertholletia excelsa]